ncbi:MAG: N4-gp56 family major capsid protein [Micrococcales bacterium]|nr:N4-gp56 family major capsid protein [Micrococcales bacterium]
MLQMEQFAMKVAYPSKTGGNKTIRFFKFDNPAIDKIVSLSEGTTIGDGSDQRQLTLSTVEATLQQYGSQIVLTDVLLATELFNHLAQATKQLGEDAALHADTLCHRALIQDSSTSTGTNVATFATSSVANSAITATDLLDGATALFISRAPKIKDSYVLVAHPAVIRDLQQDDDWLKVSSYSNPEAIFKGEIGSLFGCKVVSSTNVQTFATAAAGVASASTAGQAVYGNLLLGGNSFGVPSLNSVVASGSPFAPKVTILDAADKSDPYGQRVVASFKTFYAAKQLDTTFFRAIFAKSNYS